MAQGQTIFGFQGTKCSFSEAAVHEYALLEPNPAIVDRPFKAVGFETFKETIEAFYLRHHGSKKPNQPDELFLPIRNNNSRSVTAMQKELLALDGWIAGEYYLLVEQCFLVNPGVEFSSVRFVWSMEPAINQVRKIIQARKLQVDYWPDTAKAAYDLKETKRRDVVAIASREAGEYYKLDNLGNVCDNPYNFTHFLHVVHPSQRERFIPKLNDNHEHITKIVLQGDLFPERGTSPFEIFTKNGVRVSNPIDADEGTFAHTATIIDLHGHFKAQAILDCKKDLEKHRYKVKVSGCYQRGDLPPDNGKVRTRTPILTYPSLN